MTMKTNCGSCYVSSTLIRTNRLLNVSLAKMCLFEISREWQFGVCKHGVCVRAQSLQLCLTLCDPMDCSPPGSSVHGIFQARILEWVAMPSFRGSSNLRIEPACPSLVGGFFTAALPGKMDFSAALICNSGSSFQNKFKPHLSSLHKLLNV